MDIGVSQGFVLVQNCQKYNMVSAKTLMKFVCYLLHYSTLNRSVLCPGGTI